MSAKLGIKMIEMYCGMIHKEFEPLVQSLQERITPEVMQELEKQSKIELGVYDLYLKKEALRVQMEEIEKRLKDYEGDRYYTGEGLIKKEVRKKLEKLNEPLTKVQEAEEEIIKMVKLSGVSDEVKKIFDAIGVRMGELKKEYGSLPPIDIAAIPVTKGKKILKGKEVK